MNQEELKALSDTDFKSLRLMVHQEHIQRLRKQPVIVYSGSNEIIESSDIGIALTAPDDKLDYKLTEWFSEGHSLQETFDQFKEYPDVTRKVIDMQRSGFIYAYPTKSGIDMYVRSVRAEKEMDIGV